ncbi:MAG: PAS domain-containing protein [Acidobacteria bacterium]|nr:PAS domain-containing protein [Acidobacteriota bacterium]
MSKLKNIKETELQLRGKWLGRLSETINCIPWEASAETWQFTYVGPQAVRILGYPIHQWYEKRFWTDHIHPEDRESTIDFCLNASQTFKDYEFEYRMIAADGSVVWLSDIVTVESVDGTTQTLRGFMIDITKRRMSAQELQALSGRLLQVQEVERQRIARELHDQLSQDLALVSIEIEQLCQKASESHPHLAEQLERLAMKTQEMTSQVQTFSRQLHPSQLTDLGLVTASRSLCNEISKASNVQIDFSHSDLPNSIPQEVSVCLYRVLQDSLGNIVKHSGTRKAQVELAGHPGEIQLQVCDFGIGSDPGIRKVTFGLGLVSMRERLHSAGGTLLVESQPSAGTRIQARVPFPVPVSSN